MLKIHTEIASLSLHYSSGGVKTTFSTVMRTLLSAWPPQCHNFDSTAGAGGFTAAAPAVNMLEEALRSQDFPKGVVNFHGGPKVTPTKN